MELITMVLSRTKESQILDLILAGYSQRSIAKGAEICLATVNHRIKLFKQTGSTTYTKAVVYTVNSPIKKEMPL